MVSERLRLLPLPSGLSPALPSGGSSCTLTVADCSGAGAAARLPKRAFSTARSERRSCADKAGQRRERDQLLTVRQSASCRTQERRLGAEQRCCQSLTWTAYTHMARTQNNGAGLQGGTKMEQRSGKQALTEACMLVDTSSGDKIRLQGVLVAKIFWPHCALETLYSWCLVDAATGCEMPLCSGVCNNADSTIDSDAKLPPEQLH